MIPEFERDLSMSQECETSFNNRSMTSFNSTILMRGVRAGNSMSDAKGGEESGYRPELATPVRLNGFNFGGKLSLN
jgi:hypothetical protein